MSGSKVIVARGRLVRCPKTGEQFGGGTVLDAAHPAALKHAGLVKPYRGPEPAVMPPEAVKSTPTPSAPAKPLTAAEKPAEEPAPSAVPSSAIPPSPPDGPPNKVSGPL